MTRQEFLFRLQQGLSGLPQADVEERLAFYSEMIDDRMEDGLSEAEAVAQIGPVEEIVAQIVAETPLTKLVRARMAPAKRLQTWQIVLLILGFPLWLPLLIAGFAVLLAVYIVIFSVIVSLWGVDLSLVLSALGVWAAGILAFNRVPGLLMLGGGFILAGLSIFVFFGCRAATRGAMLLTSRIALGVKSLFLNKEERM